jgi:hypothetical integral membrane protein (TIGR02206 family)
VESAAPAFQFFGAAHLVAMMITFAAPFTLAAVARRSRSAGFDRAIRVALAVILTVNFVSYGVRGSLAGTLRWEQALPFQLCDWTMIAVIVALLNGGRPSWVEVAYFWGIGGSLQAIVTPNLQFGFPDYRFLTFFIDHCGIVIGVTYLMLTRRLRPQVGSIWRTLLWSEIYLAVTLLVDSITGVNYGFLLHKPEAFSILSYLSDNRGIYILQLNLLALVFFAALYLPFAVTDLLRKQGSHNEHKGAQRGAEEEPL